MKTLAHLIGLLFLCSFCFELQAQPRPEQDCIGAVRICDNVNFTVPVTYGGGGNIKDIPDNTTCLVNEENNSAWFFFEVDSAGTVVFTIDPLLPDDYDFAVFKAADCSEITNDSMPPVRCNYSAYGQNAFPPWNNPQTGLRFGYIGVSSGVADSIFLAPLEVLAGEKYYLVIDNFNIGGGYHLDFTGTTAKFKSEANANFSNYNSFLSYSSIAPGNIRLSFSGYFDCETTITDPTYYSITGPSNIQIDSVAVDCTTGNDSLLLIDFFYSGIFIDNGNYSFEIDGGVSPSNLCNTVTFANGNVFDFTAEVEAVNIISFELMGNSCYSYDLIFTPASAQSFFYFENDETIDTNAGTICFYLPGFKQICAVAFNNFSADILCKTVIVSSIAELDLQKSFSVYPNPATNKIFVKALGNEKIQQILVYDILGKTVNTPVQNSEANDFIIDTERLTSGLYYVHIVTEKNEVAVKKIAVNSKE
jgi:hypothetical protein